MNKIVIPNLNSFPITKNKIIIIKKNQLNLFKIKRNKTAKNLISADIDEFFIKIIHILKKQIDLKSSYI